MIVGALIEIVPPLLALPTTGAAFPLSSIRSQAAPDLRLSADVVLSQLNFEYLHFRFVGPLKRLALSRLSRF